MKGWMRQSYFEGQAISLGEIEGQRDLGGIEEVEWKRGAESGMEGNGGDLLRVGKLKRGV